ncbi:MAG: HEAT repeat domain-containing protein [Verrucomicrobiales bacterium]|nr:HEAT repeat domain-containing protein [Verrucomicrobiales bacterium]
MSRVGSFFLPVSALALLCLVLPGGSGSGRAAEAPADPPRLPRLPAVEVADALATFQVRPGFQLELAAHEPEVRDPIELCFDADGRMFVVEMIDYSELRDANPHLGRIRLLEDLDGDGRYEKSTVYANDLPWPTAVICWDGGVFVAATPDVFYLKDTDGDRVADRREKVFTGFAIDYAPYRTNQLNMQAMVNSFRWGLDNRIHGCTAPNGGEITCLKHPERKPVNVRGRDFAFDPRTLELMSEAGGGQYGLSFNDRGIRFTCNNSDHIRAFLFDDRYAGHNPDFNLPRALVSIAADGPAAPVYRTSPDEPWRVLRTQWRVAGLVPGPIEGGGRASGYFTSSTGIMIYRGDAWPPGFVGDAFIADCGSNLLHRKRVHADGVELIAQRPDDEQRTEFLTSTDTWFRPVQLANAPDGTLYLIDMYREIIEHPWSLPPGIKEQLDLNSGNDRGRIYRIVPENFRRRPDPQLSQAATAEWVRTLAHPNAWHRETAARLLYEGQDPAAVPLLEALLSTSPSPLGRLHALYALDGLQALRARHVQAGFRDADDAVREHSIRLAEQFLKSTDGGELRDALLRLAPDPSARVRFQLAFTLGELKDPRRIDALAHIARIDAGSAYTRAAVLNSLTDGVDAMFARVVAWFAPDASPAPGQAEHEFLGQLVELVGARNRPAEIAPVRSYISQADSAVAFTLVHALGEGLRRANQSLDLTGMEALLDRAADLAVAQDAPVTTRVQAIELLAARPFETVGETLLSLLTQTQPREVQLAAIRTVGRFTAPEVGPGLVARWRAWTPRMREAVLPVLLARPDRVAALFAGVEKGSIRSTDLSSVQVDFLMNHRDAGIKREAIRLLASRKPADATEALTALLPPRRLRGDFDKGRTLFVERCSSCHRLGGEGSDLGPRPGTAALDGQDCGEGQTAGQCSRSKSRDAAAIPGV